MAIIVLIWNSSTRRKRIETNTSDKKVHYFIVIWPYQGYELCANIWVSLYFFSYIKFGSKLKCYTSFPVVECLKNKPKTTSAFEGREQVRFLASKLLYDRHVTITHWNFQGKDLFPPSENAFKNILMNRVYQF